MTFQNRITGIPKVILEYIVLFFSMAGFVPGHATVLRAIAIGSSVLFALFIGVFHSDNAVFGVVYFIISEILYLGFIYLVLSKNGLRHWFIKRWRSEENGYLAFEAVLGFVFFHNGASLGFIASSSPGNLFDFMNRELLFVLVALMAVTGFIIKIWATKVVSVDIYYWKDMFLGKKVAEFVVTGPYKFLSNPMYGVGQLMGYASAIWYGSSTGLIAVVINQLLIFSFYYTVEKRFIKRVYHTHILVEDAN